uniref:Enoyl-CoA hydratase domain-containing protein 3, mitochondrial n=1 Tax=Globodera rostochiensis TaxID=31243 RepID=A0A914HQQ7_GLORO
MNPNFLTRLNFLRPSTSIRRGFASFRDNQHAQQQEHNVVAAPMLKFEWHLGNRVARLVMDDKHINSLSLSMLNQLHASLRELDARREVRAVIIAASGPAYSTGHELYELTVEAGTAKHREVFTKCLELVTFMKQMQLPVIAEVDGLVAAAGTQLVTSCDIVVASGRASFSVAGIKLGLFCATPAVPLSRCLPPKIVADMLLTGRFLDAQKAYKFGLVSRAAHVNDITRETLAVAAAICENSRSVTAMGKAFFYAQLDQNVHNAYRQATETICDNLKWRDAQEGISAFLAKPKRSKQWTHTDEKVIAD